MISRLLPALMLAAGLSSAGLAKAQERPAAPPGAEHHGWDPAEMRARMEAHRAQRLKALHDILGIRSDQEAAFAAFAASVRPPEGDRGMRPQGMGPDREAMSNLPTPERLDRMEERMARRQAAFQRRASVMKALYAALSPEQRRAMDALPMLRGAGDREKGHGPGRMGGRGMEGRG